MTEEEKQKYDEDNTFLNNKDDMLKWFKQKYNWQKRNMLKYMSNVLFRKYHTDENLQYNEDIINELVNKLDDNNIRWCMQETPGSLVYSINDNKFYPVLLYAVKFNTVDDFIKYINEKNMKAIALYFVVQMISNNSIIFRFTSWHEDIMMIEDFIK